MSLISDSWGRARIAIIGAGVSGVAAAVELCHSAPGKFEVTLFESRREAGGRTRSYVDAETGDILDNGQHLMMGCYTATLEHLRRIGSQDLVTISESLRIPFTDTGNGKTAYLESSKFLPAPLHLLRGLLRTNLLTPSEKYAAIQLGTRIKLDALPSDVDNLNCGEFLTRMHQPDGLGRKLWEPVILATINAKVRDASARLFVNVVRLALLDSKQGSALVFPTTGLSELLIDPGVALLERTQGQTVKFGTPVDAIEKDDSGEWVVRHKNESEHFDAVIIATNTNGIVMPEGIATTGFAPSPIVNAYFWIDKPILDSPIRAFLGTTLQWAFSKQTHLGGERLALTVSAAQDIVERSNAELTDLLWSDLLAAIPGARQAKLLRSQIIREKRATPLFTPATHQQRPTTTTAYHNLYLAGDLVQNGLPATIEGAVRNGQQAARRVILDGSADERSSLYSV